MSNPNKKTEAEAKLTEEIFAIVVEPKEDLDETGEECFLANG